jgi:cell shape-determining protein MreC
VVSVELDPVSPFARVLAEPSASMVRSREVLLLWPEFDKPAEDDAPLVEGQTAGTSATASEGAP